MRVVVPLLWIVMFLLISEGSGRVEAYLDPGSGSMALQMILGGLVAGLTAVRLYWERLSAFFGRRSAGEIDAERPEPPPVTR